MSSKGQVIIPKPVRAARDWKAGQELVVIDTGDGVLLRPKSPFRATDISEVASCLEYSGEAKSLDEMEAAIKKGVSEREDGGG
ncbi:MAG TPA: AbrB/MazE/SpoVT family DNA-binding domain-containing protein [Rhodothermales bacterium]|nr:AbrB/MazE/SpoVT family DNA-binding domain-containing protein [Rhodothermales bacterium]